MPRQDCTAVFLKSGTYSASDSNSSKQFTKPIRSVQSELKASTMYILHKHPFNSVSKLHTTRFPWFVNQETDVAQIRHYSNGLFLHIAITGGTHCELFNVSSNFTNCTKRKLCLGNLSFNEVEIYKSS